MAEACLAEGPGAVAGAGGWLSRGFVVDVGLAAAVATGARTDCALIWGAFDAACISVE